MKHLPLSLLLIMLLCCCTQKQHPLTLIPLAPVDGPFHIRHDTVYMAMGEKGYLLPTYYYSIERFVAKESYISPKDDYYLKDNDTIWYSHKGDTLFHAGDTVFHSGDTVIYNTYLQFEQEGIYIKSPRLLTNCQINLQYEEDAIYNKDLNRFTWRSNKGLDFLKKEGNTYVYFAPYDRWESGGYSSLGCIIIRYKPEVPSDDRIFYSGKNEISLSKDDFDKYFDLFKAHLSLK